eukprot:7064213-Prymnesium_polylepis.1
MLQQAAGLQLDAVEISQAQERLTESRRWREHARKLLEPSPTPVNEAVLEELEELAKRVEEINMALPEQPALDERLGAVKSWLARATSVLGGRGDPKELSKLVRESKALQIELAEVPRLTRQQQERSWVDAVEEALKSATTLDNLRSLVEQAAPMAAERGAEWRWADL